MGRRLDGAPLRPQGAQTAQCVRRKRHLLHGHLGGFQQEWVLPAGGVRRGALLPRLEHHDCREGVAAGPPDARLVPADGAERVFDRDGLLGQDPEDLGVGVGGGFAGVCDCVNVWSCAWYVFELLVLSCLLVAFLNLNLKLNCFVLILNFLGCEQPYFNCRMRTCNCTCTCIVVCVCVCVCMAVFFQVYRSRPSGSCCIFILPSQLSSRKR